MVDGVLKTSLKIVKVLKTSFKVVKGRNSHPSEETGEIHFPLVDRTVCLLNVAGKIVKSLASGPWKKLD